MDDDRTGLDSSSVGDPARYRALEELERSFAAYGRGPRDEGRVALIVRKAEGGRRETPERVVLTPEDGVPGDAWGRWRSPNPETQLAVMELGVAELVANAQPLALSGDNLVLDLDLSAENLPPGSRLRAGAAHPRGHAQAPTPAARSSTPASGPTPCASSRGRTCANATYAASTCAWSRPVRSRWAIRWPWSPGRRPSPASRPGRGAGVGEGLQAPEPFGRPRRSSAASWACCGGRR